MPSRAVWFSSCLWIASVSFRHSAISYTRAVVSSRLIVPISSLLVRSASSPTITNGCAACQCYACSVHIGHRTQIILAIIYIESNRPFRIHIILASFADILVTLTAVYSKLYYPRTCCVSLSIGVILITLLYCDSASKPHTMQLLLHRTAMFVDSTGFRIEKSWK